MKIIKNCIKLAGLFYFLCGITVVDAKIFDMKEFKLDNGMQVIVIPNHKAPIVKQMVWYKSGGVDEKLGKGGVAHLLEHLMFRGTKKVKDSDFNTIISENGGDSNAFTAQDFTSYYEGVDISKLELAMFLEADRMQNLKFSKDAFAKERDIVFQERMQVVENNPSSYFGEAMRRNLWQEHPYSRPITGTPEEIKNLTQDDVYDFYEHFYAPNNAILILSGDIDAKTAKILAEKYFGKVPARQIGERISFPKLDKRFNDRIEMFLPRISAVRLVKNYLAPSYNVDKKDMYNLIVLSQYLGEGETSKLYKNLVLDKKLALAVSTSYDFASRSYGGFSIVALPKENVDVKLLERELNEAINQAIAEIDLEQIEKVKGKMLAGQVYLRDNPNDAAYIVGSMAAIGMSVDEIEKHADNIKAVSHKDVKKAAENLFNNYSNVSGIIRPIEEKR